jgi:hypothetical protein
LMLAACPGPGTLASWRAVLPMTMISGFARCGADSCYADLMAWAVTGELVGRARAQAR